MLTIGIKGEKTIQVTDANTAKCLGSGDVDVFGTPAMIALMEDTARISVRDLLEPGQATVGTMIEIRHLAPTPIGMNVTCRSELIEIDRRQLTFKTEVFDAVELIGDGLQKRFIVDIEKFQAKADAKKQG